jgi:sulfur carrier protein
MISLNGEPFQPAAGATIADLLSALKAPAQGVAVAVDSEVVPRSEWGRYVVAEAAKVEVLTAVQGG